MKTETKHTPGPWSFFEHCLHDPEDNNPMYVVGPREFSSVADVRPGSSDDGLPDQTIHNAHLIAAAPELLEACQHLIALLDENIPSRLDDDEWEAVTIAKSAIRKATQPEGAES